MKDKTNDVIGLAKKAADVCPWCLDQTSISYFKCLEEEVAEIKDALDKKDFDNLENEIGDTLWVLFVLAYICEREGKIKTKNSVERILKKINNRKPWLIEGKEVTKEDAVKIWAEAKAKEKITKK
ncbi:MAG: MazG nucleotide pyrophosphohydrolase domain-containing protein [Candidatus Micrarchaeota archaeon]